jgi:hypothetical protein
MFCCQAAIQECLADAADCVLDLSVRKCAPIAAFLALGYADFLRRDSYPAGQAVGKNFWIWTERFFWAN